ncbi:hypothetical protein [Pseudonocardia aurantiaca]|uniref:Uncharacterized protein n=1 Tax=Pseudonocardia aurantiaca TaxID=75290 RepID=A0ABW4FRC3_9PSEU
MVLTRSASAATRARSSSRAFSAASVAVAALSAPSSPLRFWDWLSRWFASERWRAFLASDWSSPRCRWPSRSACRPGCWSELSFVLRAASCAFRSAPAEADCWFRDFFDEESVAADWFCPELRPDLLSPALLAEVWLRELDCCAADPPEVSLAGSALAPVFLAFFVDAALAVFELFALFEFRAFDVPESELFEFELSEFRLAESERLFEPELSFELRPFEPELFEPELSERESEFELESDRPEPPESLLESALELLLEEPEPDPESEPLFLPPLFLPPAGLLMPPFWETCTAATGTATAAAAGDAARNAAPNHSTTTAPARPSTHRTTAHNRSPGESRNRTGTSARTARPAAPPS